MAMADHLAGSEARVGEAEAVDHVVEALLEHLEQQGAGDAFAADGFREEAAELLFQHTVSVAQLLLLRERRAVVGHLAARVARAVLAGREVADFQRLGRAEEGHAEAAGDFFTGASVTCHEQMG